MKKEMTLKEFKEYVNKHDANRVEYSKLEEKDFNSHFTLVCKKCGSQKVQFHGEAGIDYGGYTGYSYGEKGFKCLDCGNALTWWE